MGSTKWLVLAATITQLLSVGCAGELGDPVGGRSESLDVRDVAPLQGVEETVWSSAPAGCEGLLTEGLDFGIADHEPGLVVAFDHGVVVCADTYPAVESELAAVGAHDDVDRLWLGYMAALQDLEPYGAEAQQRPEPGTAPALAPGRVNVTVMGDPSPQPNRPTGAVMPAAAEGGPTDGDPSPQPNGENDGDT